MNIQYDVAENSDNAIVLNITGATDVAAYSDTFCTIDTTPGITFGELGFGALTLFINEDTPTITLISPDYEAISDRGTLIARIQASMEAING